MAVRLRDDGRVRRGSARTTDDGARTSAWIFTGQERQLGQVSFGHPKLERTAGAQSRTQRGRNTSSIWWNTTLHRLADLDRRGIDLVDLAVGARDEVAGEADQRVFLELHDDRVVRRELGEGGQQRRDAER